MMKNKVLRLAFLSFVLVFLTAVTFKALISPTDAFYVNDSAKILSEETEDYILTYSKDLKEKTDAQVVVATVETLDDLSVEDYSLQLFRAWGIGDKEKNNGLLILLSLKERKVRIEIGHGLEGKINDAKAGRFLDTYGIPYFKTGDWDNGIVALYSALMNEVYAEYDLEMPKEILGVASQYRRSDLTVDDGRPKALIMLAVVLIFGIIPIFFRKNRRGGPPFYSGPTGYGGFGGGFGGSGGGSFGGFGGGGSSGGGGASRGF